MTDTSLASMSAVELTRGFNAKTLSPKEALGAVLDRLDQVEPMINAFVHVDREAAMKAAGEAEARYQAGAPVGPLDGVPVSVKDMLLTKGMPTRKGSLEPGERCSMARPRQPNSVAVPIPAVR